MKSKLIFSFTAFILLVIILGFSLAPANAENTARPSEASAGALAAQTTFSCADVTDVPESECNALVALYNSTDGENSWVNKTNWLQSNTVCTWFGVGCTAGHVSTLQLPANGLNGQLHQTHEAL